MTVFVLGGAQTDFGRNYSREGLGVDALMRDAVEAALEDTGVAPGAIDADRKSVV